MKYRLWIIYRAFNNGYAVLNQSLSFVQRVRNTLFIDSADKFRDMIFDLVEFSFRGLSFFCAIDYVLCKAQGVQSIGVHGHSFGRLGHRVMDTCLDGHNIDKAENRRV